MQQQDANSSLRTAITTTSATATTSSTGGNNGKALRFADEEDGRHRGTTKRAAAISSSGEEDDDSSRSCGAGEDTDEDEDKFAIEPNTHAAKNNTIFAESERSVIVDDVEMGLPCLGKLERSQSVVLRRKGRKTSLVTDLSTGIQGGARGQCAELRRDDSMQACPARQRQFTRFLHLLNIDRNDDDDDDHDDADRTDSQHRRVAAPRRDSMNSRGGSEDVAVSKDGRYMVSSRDVSGSFHGRDEGSSSSRQQHHHHHHHPKQYCLKAVPTHQVNRAQHSISCWRWCGSNLSIYERSAGGGVSNTACRCCWIEPNRIVINFLHWSFRQTIPTVILTAVVGFFFLTILFALMLWKAGWRSPDCIGGIDRYDSDYFTDAFILSWTTFSTVGYGLIYAGISPETTNIRRCTAVTVIVTLEAFVGVLFASMCGAILFIKISRSQSFAQVIFSDPICVRYGTGVKVESAEDEAQDDGSQSTDGELDSLPCPILEMRIANRLHSVAGGEIIDGTVNFVAIIDASQAVKPAGSSARRRRGKKGKKRGSRSAGGGRRTSATKSLEFEQRQQTDAANAVADISGNTQLAPSLSQIPETSDPAPIETSNHLGSTEETVDNLPVQITMTQSYEEDQSGSLVPRTVLSKLECDTPDHPFFKRVWNVRHTLDHHSPLVAAHVRAQIKRNRGYWPRELNSAEAVRASIHFEQILISLSGTSNADANSVYAQKVYEFCDVNVGYRFVNMLYQDEGDGSLRVDVGLLNDVMEQAGGGGETFQSVRGEFRRDVLL